MKTKNSRIVTYLRFSAGCAFFAAAAALAFVATTTNVLTTHDVAATKLAGAKSSVQDSVAGAGSELSGKDGSFQSPLGRAEEEAANRAFPFTETPFSAQLNAIVGYKRFLASSASNGGTTTQQKGKISAKNKKQPPEPPRFNTWSLIGPNTALFPNILTFTGSASTTSGRITALALDTFNGCSPAFCRLWIGAAGGGVWRTTNALSPSPSWTFLTSLNVMSNAIGSLFYDNAHVNPLTGNAPLYVGTGEPNASADSEAGLGIMKSTDGGDTWTILNAQIGPITTFSNGSGTNGTYTGNAFFGRAVSGIVVDPTNPSVLYVSSARSVRGIDSTYGGPTSNPPVPRPPFGLFKSTDGGNTFTFIWDGGNNCPGSCVGGDPNASIRGVTEVKLDPRCSVGNPGACSILYAAAFPGFVAPTGGIYRSTDAGSTWAQIKTPNTIAVSTARCAFDVTPLSGAVTRMYAGCGDQGTAPAHVFRSDNVNTAATFTDLTAIEAVPSTINYCTGQCWYDNFVYTPPGFPDFVYVGGSFTYNEFGHGSDGRGVVFASDAGSTGFLWSDFTWDAQNNVTPAGTCCQPNAIAPNGIHPDQHALVTVPGNPLLFIEGSDGGIVRSNGSLTDISAQCAARTYPPGTGTLVQCQLLTGVPPCGGFPCGVPNFIFTGMNAGLADLQFMSVSYNSSNPFNVQGGTQDNGTFQTFGSSTWNQEIYGDGGQSGFNHNNSFLRFNTFTGQANDGNFQNGNPAAWVVIGGPIAASPEGSLFYPPIIADPTSAQAGSIFQGSFGVWRTQDWGGNQAFLETNCAEFTTAFNNPACGDFVRLGGPAGANTAGSLVGAFYGGDRVGGAINVIERTTSNTSTAWAGTTGARVFISTNVDGPAASVIWNRLDPHTTVDPSRVVTGIAIDPNNTNHAWVTYSGYSAFTPSQPGHVFSVSWSGAGTASFTNIDFNLPDIPLTSVVFDPLTGDLYTSSDFAVFRKKAGVSQWDIAGIGMPIVEVPKLTINPNARRLYAATHGLSVWSLPLY